jgi:hypothetical protein
MRIAQTNSGLNYSDFTSLHTELRNAIDAGAMVREWILVSDRANLQRTLELTITTAMVSLDRRELDSMMTKQRAELEMINTNQKKELDTAREALENFPDSSI